jgi:hypothetical protein
LATAPGGPKVIDIRIFDVSAGAALADGLGRRGRRGLLAEASARRSPTMPPTGRRDRDGRRAIRIAGVRGRRPLRHVG